MKLAGCRILFLLNILLVMVMPKRFQLQKLQLKLISAYGTSKLDAEKLIEKYCKENDFRGVSIGLQIVLVQEVITE